MGGGGEVGREGREGGRAVVKMSAINKIHDGLFVSVDIGSGDYEAK